MDCHMSQSRVSPKNESSTTLAARRVMGDRSVGSED